jgi:hypothetical protein
MNSQDSPSSTRQRDQKGSVAMNTIANEVARARIRDLRADARAGSRARRLIAAQRWQRRAERAARRAQLARNSIW